MSYISDDDDFYKSKNSYSEDEYSTDFFLEELDQDSLIGASVMVSVVPSSDWKDYNEVKEILNLSPRLELKIEEVEISEQIESYMRQMKVEKTVT